MYKTFDVAIIGGGVVGCAIARELSRYRLDVVVLEREPDVARGTSSKNSGVVHTGINVPPGSLKARLNVAGAAAFEALCRELDVPFKRVGKLVIAMRAEEAPELQALLTRGSANGVPDLEIIDSETVRRLEPNVSGYAALHAPTAAITCPYSLTIALAENAASNGVAFQLESPVTSIVPPGEAFTLTTPSGLVNALLVINSAGLHADRVARMAGLSKYRVYPCRGEYVILDKSRCGLITRMVYPVPPKGGPGLGVHITPTVDGNILLGPSATYIRGRDDVRTTMAMRRQLLKEAAELLPGISPGDAIAAYSGVRPKTVPSSRGGFGDFIIEEPPETLGMLHLVGIESPGLTAAPAIAALAREWVLRYLPRPESPRFNGRREPSPRFRELVAESQAALAAVDPDYGQIVCRCELVTKAEVLESIRNPLGAKSLISIKYRSRAMMGRCQGGFCGPRVVDLLRETGVPVDRITLRGGGSWMFAGTTRGTANGAGRAPVTTGAGDD
ncbi:MAG: NAD(P)/FAD-dependent oxidoreductase [Chloroflexi bacterium]|nr:NAD(P)/FAD-dependent oxidoreductase [Chloroflexota bacterium]